MSKPLDLFLNFKTVLPSQSDALKEIVRLETSKRDCEICPHVSGYFCARNELKDCAFFLVAQVNS